jgi:predicted nucleotidyltransferase
MNPECVVTPRDSLDEAVRRLVDALHPERIYLFGSHARGDGSADSDYDLLIVVPHSDLPGHRRDTLALAALWGIRLPVDVLVLTASEFNRKLGVKCSLPATVVREGRLLHAA